MFQKVPEIVKTSSSLNDFKQRETMILSCSEKTISITYRNNL